MTNDPTALARQTRRIARLKSEGIERTTVLIHQRLRSSFDFLRPMLADPSHAALVEQLVAEIIEHSSPKNVSQVRQLSPFRYPGGKTWLVPEVRRWLSTLPNPLTTFIEPFAGGAMCGLSVASECLSDVVVLSELDSDVAAVWQLIFSGTNEDVEWLCARIDTFGVTEVSVRQIIDSSPVNRRERAFRTIVRNRVQRAGILAPGAGIIKAGENGRGLKSRWYPGTLVKRIRALQHLRDRVQFIHGDAFDVIADHRDDELAAFLIDPPYTAGGKNAGTRLYTHHAINHHELFGEVARVRGAVMMTYDDTDEVKALAAAHGFTVSKVAMKSSHHKLHKELIITKP